jgi:hypothetical protein
MPPNWLNVTPLFNMTSIHEPDLHWHQRYDTVRGPLPCKPAFDVRPHFTSLECATSEPMVRIAELLRAGDLEAARRTIELCVRDNVLSEFHELNLFALVEGIAAGRALDKIARLRARRSPLSATRVAKLEREVADHQSAAAAFLEAALDAARTPHEQVVVHENRASLALMRGDAHAAVLSLIAALRVEQTETLWANLLLALERVGSADVDRVLEVLGPVCPRRLLDVISEPDRDLADVHRRPAYHRFLARATAHVRGETPQS